MQTIREQETQHILAMQKKIETLRNALNDLLFGYQQLMETGFHRIRDLGGTCDPVHIMYANSPDVRAALTVLEQTK